MKNQYLSELKAELRAQKDFISDKINETLNKGGIKFLSNADDELIGRAYEKIAELEQEIREYKLSLHERNDKNEMNF